MTAIRRPAVAGQFYPGAAGALRNIVHTLLDHAARRLEELGDDLSTAQAIRAVIVPHAVYAHSGPIAASAYLRLSAGRDEPRRSAVRRIILLGPAHYAPVQGLAASSAAAFATPLGDVPLHRPALDELLQRPYVHVDDDAHAPEHGLEVQLPFLQTLFPYFHLIPLVCGPCPPRDVAAVLQRFTRASDLIVVSSDLSHFRDYRQARRLDHRSAQRIEWLQPLAAGDACGRIPVNGLLYLARRLGWRARTVDLRNSGDTGGTRHRVVGYGAFTFEGPAAEAHLVD